MNRRHFFALSLPVLLGGGASAVSAQSRPASRPSARRVRMEIVRMETSHAKTGHRSPQTIVVATDADVATYGAFVQGRGLGEGAGTPNLQAAGPHLCVTPHIEADGRITVTAEAQFGEHDRKTIFAARVESGKKVCASGMTRNGVTELFYVTATVLEPPLKI